MSNQDLVTRVDLHIHTNASDGLDSTDEIILKAHERFKADGDKPRVISITDHDSVDGLYPSQKPSDYNLNLIPGIELSVLCDLSSLGYTGKPIKSEELHLLGYGIDPKNRDLNSALQQNRDRRRSRLLEMVSNVNKLLKKDGKPEIEDGDTQDIKGYSAPSRTHLARLLVERGIVKTIKEAFDRYLVSGNVPKRQIPFEEGSNLIKQAGGIAVLAHPSGKPNHSLVGITSNLIYQAAIIKSLAERGLIQGLECYYPDHGDELPNSYLTLCNQMNLIPTGGSDHHGGEDKDRLGRFYVPDFVGELLLERLAV